MFPPCYSYSAQFWDFSWLAQKGSEKTAQMDCLAVSSWLEMRTGIYSKTKNTCCKMFLGGSSDSEPNGQAWLLHSRDEPK